VSERKREQFKNFVLLNISKTDLRETKIDGDGFGDVQEAPVCSECKSKAIERLKNVRALVLLKEFQRQSSRRSPRCRVICGMKKKRTS
jgi:hypothetical protein